jgi:hypothetical protein
MEVRYSYILIWPSNILPLAGFALDKNMLLVLGHIVETVCMTCDIGLILADYYYTHEENWPVFGRGRKMLACLC